MTPAGLQSGFVRAVEAEYVARAARYRVAGVDAQEAHRLALAEAKGVGRQALDVLHRRGLFPWAEVAGAGAADPEGEDREGR